MLFVIITPTHLFAFDFNFPEALNNPLSGAQKTFNLSKASPEALKPKTQNPKP